MFGCNFFVVFFKTSCLELWNAVGPLQLVNCVLQNCHVGEQSHWEKINKEKFYLKWRKPFDLLVLVLPLLSTEHGSFVPRKWLLQRARWIRFKWVKLLVSFKWTQHHAARCWTDILGPFKRILENDIPWLTGGYAGAGAIWFCAIMLGSQQQQSWLREHCDVHGPMQLPWQGTISILLSLVNL